MFVGMPWASIGFQITLCRFRSTCSGANGAVSNLRITSNTTCCGYSRFPPCISYVDEKSNLIHKSERPRGLNPGAVKSPMAFAGRSDGATRDIGESCLFVNRADPFKLLESSIGSYSAGNCSRGNRSGVPHDKVHGWES